MDGIFMKEITFNQIKENVSLGLLKACCNLNTFTLNKLKKAYSEETSPLAKET